MLRGLLTFLHRLSYFLFLFHLVCDWDIMAIVLIRFVFFLVPPPDIRGLLHVVSGRYVVWDGG